MHSFFMQLAEALISIGALVFIAQMVKRTLVEATVQVACASGDSETMTFNLNLSRFDSEDKKHSRINEAFQLIEERREENHQKWLKVKAQAEAEVKAAGSPLQAVPSPEGHE